MTPQPRNIKDRVAFCWQSKAANRKIREAFDATRNVSSALAVYMALTEIASDEASETFDQTVGYIAGKAGVSPRTVTTISPGLQGIGLVSIRENTIPGTKLKGPNTYTLLPIGNGCASIRNGRKRPSLPRIEEHKEEHKKNDDEKAPGSSLAGEQTDGKSSSLNFVSSIEEAEKHPLWKEFCRWAQTPTLKGFNTWLKSQPNRRSKPKRKPDPPKRETREPSDEEFARVGKIAREALAEFKAKQGYG